MSDSWKDWCYGKFDGLNDGLYIVFRTTNNDDPLYVLKHYKPDDENKLDIHNPITILQKDKHNNDYQSHLELGRGDNVGDTGFVKKGDNYIGIYDLPGNVKYNNRDSIKNKLDNESTINNFYEHGIYDWLIADAIMEHMGTAEVQNKESLLEENERLKNKMISINTKYKVKLKDSNILSTLVNFFDKNTKIDQIDYVLNIQTENIDIDNINLNDYKGNGITKPSTNVDGDIEADIDNISSHLKYAIVSTICTIHSNALSDLNKYNILCNRMKDLNNDYNCTEITFDNSGAKNILTNIKKMYISIEELANNYQNDFDENINNKIANAVEQFKNNQAQDFIEDITRQNENLINKLRELKESKTIIENEIRTKTTELATYNSTNVQYGDLLQNIEVKEGELKKLEQEIIEKKKLQIENNTKYQTLLASLAQIAGVTEGDSKNEEAIILALSGKIDSSEKNIGQINELKDILKQYFQLNENDEDELNNSVNKVIENAQFKEYKEKIVHHYLFDNINWKLPGLTNTTIMNTNFEYKPENHIKTAISNITKVLNSGLKYYLAINPNFKQDDDFNAESAWKILWTEIGSSNDVYQLKKHLLQFLYIDTRYEHWANYSLFSSDWNDGVYKMNKIIEDYKKKFLINDPKLITGIANNIGIKKIQLKQNQESNILHIADFIRIYEYMKNNNDSNAKKYYGSVLNAVFSNYITFMNTNKNKWYNNTNTIIETINGKIEANQNENNGKMSGMSGIKEKLQAINDTKIITMVKINNYSTELSSWNTSYLPFTSKNNNFLKLLVNNNATQYSSNCNFEFLDDSNFREYTFGNFSNLFKPNQPKLNDQIQNLDDQNTDIKEMMDAEQTKTIEKQLSKGNDVFIFGYGASGAGKTAMLVYNNKKNKTGYCISLCESIIQNFYEHNAATSPTVINTTFKFKVIITEYDNKNINKILVEQDCTLAFLPSILKDYVTDPTKGNRNIKATRNNLESSRSHVLIEFQFPSASTSTPIKKGKNIKNVGSLFIADLAGVESRFDIKDSRTIIETMDKIDFKSVDYSNLSLRLLDDISINSDDDYKKKLLDEINTGIKEHQYTYNTDSKKIDISIPNFNNVDIKFDYNVEKEVTLEDSESYDFSIPAELSDFCDKINEKIRKIMISTPKPKQVDRESRNKRRLSDNYLDCTEEQSVNKRYNYYHEVTDYIADREWKDQHLQRDDFSILNSLFQQNYSKIKKWWSKASTNNHGINDDYSVNTYETDDADIITTSSHGTPKYSATYEESNYNNSNSFWGYETNNKLISSQHKKKSYIYLFRKGNKIMNNDGLQSAINKCKKQVKLINNFFKFIQDVIIGKNQYVLFDHKNIKYAITKNLKIYKAYIRNKPKPFKNTQDFLHDFCEKNDFYNFKFKDLTEKSPSEAYDTIENNITCKTIIENYSNTFKEYQTITKTKKEIQKRISYTISEIQERNKEGDYINTELKNLREDMLKTIYHKSDKSLFTCPNVETSCLSTLCSTDENKICYMMKCKNDPYSHTSSNIMNTVIKNNPDNLKTTTIVVFTVFNISEKGTDYNSFLKINNNIDLKYSQESSIYIDLNNLKQAHRLYINDTTKKQNLIDEIIKLKSFITKSKHSSIENIKNDIINMTIRGVDLNLLNNLDHIYKIIDDHNASTPLGTLIFTDNIAKFGTFDSVCYSKNKSADYSNYSFAIENITNDTLLNKIPPQKKTEED